MKVMLIVIFTITAVANVCATAKKFVPEEGGFQPSSLRYYESELPRNKTGKHEPTQSKENSDRLERFGYVSSFGNTGNGGGSTYGHTDMGTMAPMKFDIGGVALGALIGLGAVLIIPKLAHLFSSGYGYRSLDNDAYSLTDILAKVDNTLEENNIDSTSCMQRFVCSYVHQAQKNIQQGKPSTVDQLIHTFSNNSLFSYMLDGSSIKQAMEMGKETDTDKCAGLYTKCPVTKDNLAQLVANLIPTPA